MRPLMSLGKTVDPLASPASLRVLPLWRRHGCMRLRDSPRIPGQEQWQIPLDKPDRLPVGGSGAETDCSPIGVRNSGKFSSSRLDRYRLEGVIDIHGMWPGRACGMGGERARLIPGPQRAFTHDRVA